MALTKFLASSKYYVSVREKGSNFTWKKILVGEVERKQATVEEQSGPVLQGFQHPVIGRPCAQVVVHLTPKPFYQPDCRVPA